MDRTCSYTAVWHCLHSGHTPDPFQTASLLWLCIAFNLCYIYEHFLHTLCGHIVLCSNYAWTNCQSVLSIFLVCHQTQRHKCFANWSMQYSNSHQARWDSRVSNWNCSNVFLIWCVGAWGSNPKVYKHTCLLDGSQHWTPPCMHTCKCLATHSDIIVITDQSSGLD